MICRTGQHAWTTQISSVHYTVNQGCVGLHDAFQKMYFCCSAVHTKCRPVQFNAHLAQRKSANRQRCPDDGLEMHCPFLVQPVHLHLTDMHLSKIPCALCALVVRQCATVASNNTLCSQQIRPTSLQHATIHAVFQKLLLLFRHQESFSAAQACCMP